MIFSKFVLCVKYITVHYQIAIQKGCAAKNKTRDAESDSAPRVFIYSITICNYVSD